MPASSRHRCHTRNAIIHETPYHQPEEKKILHEIALLNRRLEKIKEECDRWHDKYNDALARYNEEKIRQVYADCKTFEANVTKEIDALRAQKKTLKADLKRGRIDNISYQRQLTPLKKRVSDLSFQIKRFKFEKVEEAFPDEEAISFNLIERFVGSSIKSSQVVSS